MIDSSKASYLFLKVSESNYSYAFESKGMPYNHTWYWHHLSILSCYFEVSLFRPTPSSIVICTKLNKPLPFSVTLPFLTLGLQTIYLPLLIFHKGTF